jgi:GT2 family glycosyltransferase
VSRVGVVAIGRNEGDRLKRCLESLLPQCDRIVYVDSGSTDGSLSLARRLGAEVLALDMSQPFSAARARNAGFQLLVMLAPDTDLVQFVDGDCELVPQWLPHATAFMTTHPEVAVACGRRRERDPDASIYNHLCDIEWDTPIGEAESCGGDFLIRASAFEAVRGFSEELIAGEEPDLCWRLRRLGWKVHRLDAEMTIHDAAMTRFSQWWVRNKRSGHAFAEAVHRRGGWRDIAALKPVISNVLWAMPPLWVMWPLLWWKAYRLRRDSAYATFIVLGKLPHFEGQVGYWLHRWRGQASRLIEYK